MQTRRRQTDLRDFPTSSYFHAFPISFRPDSNKISLRNDTTSPYDGHPIHEAPHPHNVTFPLPLFVERNRTKFSITFLHIL